MPYLPDIVVLIDQEHELIGIKINIKNLTQPSFRIKMKQKAMNNLFIKAMNNLFIKAMNNLFIKN